MRVSVVVISKNERALDGTLTALADAGTAAAAALPVDPVVELVVVDASQGRLDDIRRSHPDVRWVDFAPVPGKRITIPEQRNRGVRVASGDVVVFTDAGCRPHEGWLEELVAPIVRGEESVTCGVTGSLGGPSVYDAHTVTEDYVAECATINLAFTRAAFDAVAGFDEAFDYCSDSDFTWRLNDAGYRIRRVAGARLDHEWGGARRQAKRAWYYGAGRARLYLKHRNRQRWATMARQDPILVAYPVFLLGLPLTLRLRPYPLLLLLPLWRNRRHQPLRTLLDHLCYGAGALSHVAKARA
ncbi:glycosyltransferase family 2 protein [Motilibacter aurantiacus]|uniref:glycosyltransferase family 2 protein n=1 Tax=Motilibacter aurantiacus TaxID=2714955 RepID=UPI00140CBBCD|nr:glycosyltransferase [Motilibacter aurantiacus]NHC47028.1 glycosyltransferase [Motilibacter aurantiacus]